MSRSKGVSALLETELFDQFTKKAQENDVSKSQVIVDLVTNWVENDSCCIDDESTIKIPMDEHGNYWFVGNDCVIDDCHGTVYGYDGKGLIAVNFGEGEIDWFFVSELERPVDPIQKVINEIKEVIDEMSDVNISCLTLHIDELNRWVNYLNQAQQDKKEE